MKKTYIYKMLALLALPVLFYFVMSGFKGSSETNVTAPPTGSGDWSFTNFIYNMGYNGRYTNDPWYHQSVEQQINNYGDSLHYDGIHIYSGANTINSGFSFGGSFNDNLNDYQSYVNGLMGLVNSKNLKGIYGRAKIEMLCQAQSVDYEVSENGSTTENYGFCWQEVMQETYTTDSGRTVLHASTIPSEPNSPGWLCRNIYENIQHSDNVYWQWCDTGKWYIRPMMRIKQSDYNAGNTTPVVAVIVKNYLGNTVDSIIIRVNNFRNVNQEYYGQYINKFRFDNPADPDSLQISGNTSISDLNYGRTNYPFDWENNCRVDFRIYWFGYVDVWFDKLTVQDKWAEELFSPDPEINHDTKIAEEVNAFSSNCYSFFADEMTYSNLPCVKYVRDKIKAVNGNARFIMCESNWQNVFGTRSDTIYFKALMDIVNPDIFTVSKQTLRQAQGFMVISL